MWRSSDHLKRSVLTLWSSYSNLSMDKNATLMSERADDPVGLLCHMAHYTDSRAGLPRRFSAWLGPTPFWTFRRRAGFALLLVPRGSLRRVFLPGCPPSRATVKVELNRSINCSYWRERHSSKIQIDIAYMSEQLRGSQT